MIKRSKKSLVPIKLALFFVLAAVLLVAISWGGIAYGLGTTGTGYQISPNTSSSTIDTPVGCKLVSSKAGVSYFIPTKSATEWTTFAANKPAPIGIYECNAPACTSWGYTDWSACVNNVQTRTQIAQYPAGCIGDAPAANLTNDCSCTSCTFDSGTCYPDNWTRYELLDSYPPGCTGCSAGVTPCSFVSHCVGYAGPDGACSVHKHWDSHTYLAQSYCGSGPGDGPYPDSTTYGTCATPFFLSMGCSYGCGNGWCSSDLFTQISEWYCMGTYP